jgi:hypothetical protein
MACTHQCAQRAMLCMSDLLTHEVAKQYCKAKRPLVSISTDPANFKSNLTVRCRQITTCHWSLGNAIHVLSETECKTGRDNSTYLTHEGTKVGTMTHHNPKNSVHTAVPYTANIKSKS